MRKFYLLLISTIAAITAAAAPKVTVVPLEDYNPNATMRVVNSADVLVNEDFSLFKKGTVEEPYIRTWLANKSDDINIPTEFTHGQQWTGHLIYEAGGALAMRTENPMDVSLLQTPRGDFSGAITISFKAKYLKVEWEETNEETGETGKYHWTGSSIRVGLASDSGQKFETSEGVKDGKSASPYLADIRLYPNQGWSEITIEIENYSAYNDASVAFICPDGIILDDIKVTSRTNEFIATPVITGITDVTETSFTVNFEPVRASFNYNFYLLELVDYDAQGKPIFDITFPESYIEQVLAEMAQYGWEMTWEEYKAMAGFSIDDPYSYCAQAENEAPYKVTIEGLNPAKDYYIGVRSHHVALFSEMKPIKVTQIAAPIALDAIGITTDSFTANWSKVTKAEKYEVDLYGVNEAQEDVEDFIVYYEDFELTGAFTDSQDILVPEYVGSVQGICLDDMTTTPGWTSNVSQFPIVQGELGLSYSYLGAWLCSPAISIGASDEVTLSLRIEATADLPVNLTFAGVTYSLPIYGGEFVDEVKLPTNGLIESNIKLESTGNYTFFVDYLILSQNLKKGDRTFTFLGTNQTTDLAWIYSGLDNEAYDMYGFGVRSIRGEGASLVKSETSNRIVICLKDNASSTKVQSQIVETTEIARYTIDGIQVNKPQKGINIIRYSDGTVRKVLVK